MLPMCKLRSVIKWLLEITNAVMLQPCSVLYVITFTVI